MVVLTGDEPRVVEPVLGVLEEASAEASEEASSFLQGQSAAPHQGEVVVASPWRVVGVEIQAPDFLVVASPYLVVAGQVLVVQLHEEEDESTMKTLGVVDSSALEEVDAFVGRIEIGCSLEFQLILDQ